LVINAQTTYILVRHAEKDTSAQGSQMMAANPSLSSAGTARALRLAQILESYQVTQIYSTNFTRTQQTAAPFAQKKQLNIQTYEYKNGALNSFAQSLLTLQKEVVLIVGHSNTTPTLANLLLNEQRFNALSETEYGKIFILRRSTDTTWKVEIVDY
jgi:broad specificity phosphatase PhoE